MIKSKIIFAIMTVVAIVIMIVKRILNNDTDSELCVLSRKIINDDKTIKFDTAYNMFCDDGYDYAAKRQSIKKWENELEICHSKLGLPWD